MLASAYALCNHKETALNLIRNVSQTVDPYRQTGGTFGSSTRDKAIILQSIVSLDMQEEAYRILEQISADLSKNQWMSTQTTAYALLAASDYVNHFVGKLDAVKVDVKDVNGKTENVNIKTTVHQQELPIKDGKSSVQVKNNSQATLYVRQVTSGVPLDVVTDQIMSNLSMNVVYYAEGKRINPDSIAQGTDVIAEISIRNTGTTGLYENLALNFLLPSGYEIINDRLTGNDDAFKNADYFDIRDDRYYVYFSLQTNQLKTFTFRFNAAFPGNYLQPAIQCSAMYDDTIEAVLPGGRMTIYRNSAE
ncbi:MAG: hypothetical protein LIO65_00855 [Odoribacter sp.]|nr:hypothetical protein [Odoribacter sp.]